MANAFWTFVNRFVPGTKVKAAEANAQFDGVTTGFDMVDVQLAIATTASINATAASDAATAAAATAQITANSGLTVANAALPRAGGTMTGALALAFDSAGAMQATTQQQVAAALALKADLASPVFTGNVEVPAPNLATDAAPMGYVDTQNIAQDVTLALLLLEKAGLDSPEFTGIPLVPTAPGGTNTDQAASTSFVLNSVAASVAGVASFNGRTGLVTMLASDVSSTLGYTPFNPVGSLQTLRVEGPTPWISYRDTDTAVNNGGLWTAGAVNGSFRVWRNTAVAGDYSAYDPVLEVNQGTFAFMGNSVFHTGNLVNLAQLSNTPGFISASGAPVQSVFGRTGNVTLGFTDTTTSLGYTPVQQGSGVGQISNLVKIGWSAGSKLKATIDTTDIGNIAMEAWVTSQNFLTAITGGQVTAALGFTPYNATNPSAFVNAASGNNLWLSKTGGTVTGDVTLSRSFAPATGVLFLGNSGSRYLYYDGTTYYLPGANLSVGGRFFGHGAGFGLGSIYVQGGGSPGGANVGDLWLIY